MLFLKFNKHKKLKSQIEIHEPYKCSFNHTPSASQSTGKSNKTTTIKKQ